MVVAGVREQYINCNLVRDEMAEEECLCGERPRCDVVWEM